MKKHLWVVLIAAGVVLVGYSIAIGESTLYLAIVFPVVMVSGWYGFLGVVLILLGISYAFVILFVSGTQIIYSEENGHDHTRTATQQDKKMPSNQKKSLSAGGILFLGPVPIVFGSDVKITKVMLLLAIIVSIIVIIAFCIVIYHLI